MNEYYELLQTEEWKSKREEILNRDQNKCEGCNNYSLLSQFRISLNTIGTYSSGKVVIIVYDKEKDVLHRCVSKYFIKDFQELLDKNFGSSILCLSIGANDFCKVVSIIFTKELIDYSSIEKYKDDDFKKYSVERQKLQENYLYNLSSEEFKELRWIDTRFLHIHHKYYCLNKKPWEYPNDAFQTLCWKCHENLHKSKLIPVYDLNFHILGHYTPCTRCSGAGYIPIYSHVQQGVCFACNGKRF